MHDAVNVIAQRQNMTEGARVESLSLYAQPAKCLYIFSFEGPDNVFLALKPRLY